MGAKSDLVRIEHMLEYAKKAQKFSEGIQLEQLIEDEVAQCY